MPLFDKASWNTKRVACLIGGAVVWLVAKRFPIPFLSDAADYLLTLGGFAMGVATRTPGVKAMQFLKSSEDRTPSAKPK